MPKIERVTSLAFHKLLSASSSSYRKLLSPLIMLALVSVVVFSVRVRSAGNPSVVINKYQNSGTTADIVELLVIQDGLDMRGMIIKDFSSNMANDGGGRYQFSTNSLWSSVRAGTLIVLRNNNSAADTLVGGTDFNLDVGMQNTTYFSPVGTGTFDIATTEMVMIKAAGSGDAGVTGSIHVLAGGTAGAQFTSAPVPKLRAAGTSGTNQFVFANSSTQTINDFDGTDATGAATGLTFGAGNNANNTAYINSLRVAGTPTPTPSPTATPTPTPVPTPAISINDVAQAEGNSSTTPFTFTVSLSLPADAGGVTFDVDTADNTATTGNNDYVPFHATGMTIPAGSSSTSFTVQVNGDTTPEPNETFFVNISNVTGGGVNDGQALVTILNDEGVGSPAVVISQVYGGGGNSGSTFKNDFIELYNRSSAPVNLSGWMVQFAGPTAAFTALSPFDGSPLTTNLSGTIQPGHYLLVRETAGAGGTTDLPPADVVGAIAVGSTQGKVALLNNTTILSGNCPNFAASGIVDFVGYGAADCAETTPTAVVSNTIAVIRENGGCTDTDHNFNDFDTSGGPIPRNSSSPVNTCGGDPTQLGAVGSSSPSSVDPAQNVLLTVTVTTATIPPSTGILVSGDLTSIGGGSSQQFYDDGTHGDAVAGNNVYSFLATVDAFATTGVKNIPVVVTDVQARMAFAGITVSVASPTCGVERWSVKVGTDPDASLVDLSKATPVTMATMRGWTAPASPPLNARVAPYETTVWVIQGTLINYKKEDDVDYHIVVQDGAGNTVITEVPCPCCSIGSPFESRIANARQTFDGKLTAQPFFQNPNIPVRIIGVGFFDFIHGQTGVAPNGIEVHSILDIAFPTAQSGPTTAGSNVATQAGDVNLVFGNVSSPGTTTSTPIDPSSAGPAPGGGYSLVGPAFDISTTATATGPYNVCINVPYITDPVAFTNLKLLHKEGGVLVDRTTGENFATKIICGNAPTLSPFVVALGSTPTAANAVVGGTIMDDRGFVVPGAVVTLSGSQSRKTITNANGYYEFDDITPAGFYTVTPSRTNYSFSPSSRSFSQIGNRTDAAFNATFNGGNANPLDMSEYFVRQHYLDFLGREPDEAGFNFWSNQILECGTNAQCTERRRINVSAAYFLSIEFQETGGFVDGLYRASYGRRPAYSEFMPDSAALAQGLIVGTSGWQAQLAGNKRDFAEDWVKRPAFRAAYDHLNDGEYVDALISHTAVTFTQDERNALVGELSNWELSRAGVLQRVVEDQRFIRAKQNEAFVMMEYFGYLRRDPDDNGYQFWLNKLNQFGGNFEQAEMVKAFINSGEYRDRFTR
jgi:hypothetical protein